MPVTATFSDETPEDAAVDVSPGGQVGVLVTPTNPVNPLVSFTATFDGRAMTPVVENRSGGARWVYLPDPPFAHGREQEAEVVATTQDANTNTFAWQFTVRRQGLVRRVLTADYTVPVSIRRLLTTDYAVAPSGVAYRRLLTTDYTVKEQESGVLGRTLMLVDYHATEMERHALASFGLTVGTAEYSPAAIGLEIESLDYEPLSLGLEIGATGIDRLVSIGADVGTFERWPLVSLGADIGTAERAVLSLGMALRSLGPTGARLFVELDLVSLVLAQAEAEE